MMGVFSIVFSCKTELLEDESTNPTTQNAIAKQILFKELQKQAPQIAKKVSKFSPVDISARTYTDSENDFSIDTEKSLYIEDAKGNKTYTFKMTRAEHNEAVLENLVLKDIGNGEFEAYIATYDSYALQNYSNLSLEDVKNHITMVYIGDRLGSEIFGKANASQCYVTIFTGTTDVYVPGTWCYSGEHNYSHIDDCDYLLKHKAGPTQGYFTTASTFDTYDMCQSGGGSAGSGDGSGVSTSPYGYNGSGGNLFSTHDPCLKIANMFTDTKFKEKVTALDKPQVFDYDHEMGYAAGYPPANTGVTGTQYPPMENTIGSHTVNLPSGDQYFGFIHTHNNESNGGVPIKIFSPADLAVFLTSCVANADQNGNITDAYAMVITSEGNYILDYTGFGPPLGIGTNTIKFWKTWYEREMEKLILEDQLTQPNIERVFLRFLKEKVKINGIELYKVDKTTGKASELTLDTNNNTLPIPCP
jgi:hypothetical protein